MMINDQTHLKAVIMSNHTRSDCDNTDSCYPNDGYCDDGYSWCGYETGVDCTDCGNCPDEDCPEPEGCIWDASNYGAADCDAAWTDFGLDCATMESTYGWICTGCECPGDTAGDDGGSDDGGSEPENCGNTDTCYPNAVSYKHLTLPTI